MARLKQAFTQRNFALGEILEDFLEGDDLEARQASMRKASNVRVTNARTVKARHGTIYRRNVGTAEDVIEVRPASGIAFGLILKDDALEIIDETSTLVQTISSVPWTDSETVWIEPFRDRTVIGGPFGLYVLTYTGTFALAAMTFALTSGAEIAQPYWAYRTDVTIQPSAVTGAITLTASGALWTAAYVGLRVRYGGREIAITGYTSATVVSGTVVSSLPPSFNITVASSASFRVGDAVIGKDTNFQGLVTAIAGAVLSVVTISFFDGPDVGESLSSPTGSSNVTVKAGISPLASPIWDEPLMSAIRGYPGAGSSASGRLALVDFPNVPDLVAMSSARDMTDFQVGAEDDDAIVRQIGDNSPRFLHAVNAGDLLLFSDRGIYYIPLRDNGILSPSTFNAVLFDKRAANSVRPVQVDDGVVFVEGSGETISAALLDGNIYLKWSVQPISNFHSHLIKTPKKLCPPPIYSNSSQKYLFVVNEDGTVAVVSWLAQFGRENIGFIPWVTQGSFVNVAPLFGGYWAIVDRFVGGATLRFLEEFSEDAVLDCSTTYVSGVASHLPGQMVHLWHEGKYGGETIIDDSGVVEDNGNLTPNSIYGYNFVARVQPWPIEKIDSVRAGMLRARLMRTSVSVLDTLTFQCRTNLNTRTIETYAVGDDLSEPGPQKTKLYRFPVFGNRDHPEVEFIKHEPGSFHILAITQEVQA